MSKLLVWFLFLFLSFAGLKTKAHLPFLWQSGAACGSADLFVTHVCVCVRVLCHRVLVFVVVVVVQCVCAHALALCFGSLGLHAAVRTYLPPVCV